MDFVKKEWSRNVSYTYIDLTSKGVKRRCTISENNKPFDVECENNWGNIINNEVIFWYNVLYNDENKTQVYIMKLDEWKRIPITINEITHYENPDEISL